MKETAQLQRLPVVNFAAGGIATPADAALMMRLGADGVFVGSGIFKAKNPEKMASAIVEAVNNYDNPSVLAEISKEKKAKLTQCKELSPILNKVQIVIVATNRLPADFDINKLNPGVIVFDSSYPRKISAHARNDILVIDGVSIRPPGKVEFNFDFGLPKNLCYPCMAEPIILSLERKFENFSLGKEIDPLKVKEIMRMGAKHGFEIASLTSQEKFISNDEIIAIKNNSQRKKIKVRF